MIESCPVPTRVRPFAKTQQATPALLKIILGRPLAPTRREYDEAVAGLNVGDTLMDPVADWLMQSPKIHRGMFQQALTQGVESLSDCPPELQALFAEVDRVPAWVDRQLMDEGIRFIHASGLTALQVMRDLALQLYAALDMGQKERMRELLLQDHRSPAAASANAGNSTNAGGTGFAWLWAQLLPRLASAA